MKKLNHYIFIAKSMLIACVVLLGTVGVPFAVMVEAAFNPEINYQGKLGDSSGSTVTDGTYQIVFNLYTVSSGGSPIWTETRSGGNEVQVTKGLFSVMLGEVQPLTGINWNQTLYLGVTIEADAEMTPRKKLGTVPSAFEAQRLDGLASTSFIRSDTANATNTTNTALILTQNGTGDILNLFDGSNEVFTVLDGGNVGIGTSSPYAKLSVVGEVVATNFTATSSTATSTFAGGFRAGGSDGLFVLQNGNIGVGASSPSGALQLHRASGQTDLVISTNVNLGSTNTNSLQFISDYDGTPNTAIIGQFNDGSLRLSGGSSLAVPDLVITDDGNVGIGTSTLSSKLTVNGTSLLYGTTTVTNGQLNITYANSSASLPGIQFGGGATGLFNNGSGGVGLTYSGTQVGSFGAGGVYGVQGLSNSSSGRAIDAVQSNASGYAVYSSGGINYFSGNVGVGTTTPGAKLSVAGGSAWIDGTVTASSFIGTSTATSTFAGGIQTTALDVTGGATSTFAQGINIATGCFAVNGTCIGGGGGGSGTVNSGTLGQVAFYNANGTAVSGTSTLTILDEKIGIGTSSPWAKLSISQTTGGTNPLFTIASSTSGIGTSTLFHIDAYGQVGIGTTSPAATFAVSGTSYVSGTSTVGTIRATTYTDTYRYYGLSELAFSRTYNRFTQVNPMVATTSFHAPTNYYLATSTTNLSSVMSTNNSGATYNPVNNSLFMVNNSNIIYEFTLEGTLLRTITLTNFTDTEALGWMYDDWFVIGDEQGTGITWLRIPNGTTTVSRTSGTTINTSVVLGTGNQTIEGVSYDPDRDVFYVAKEGGGSSYGVYTITRDGTITTTFATTSIGTAIGDISDMYYDRNTQHFFLAVDQCTGQANGPSSTACDGFVEVAYDGQLLDRIHAPVGFTQVEGIGFTPDGSDMFIVGEGDMYAWYKYQDRGGQFAQYAPGNASTTPWNIGIGTTSPWARVSISGDGFATNTTQSMLFAVGSSTTSYFAIDSFGRTGLGTTSPYAKLSIQGDTASAAAGNAPMALSVYGGTGSTTGTGGAIHLQSGIGGTSGSGGAFTINAGAAGSSGAGAGGAINLSAGAGGASGGAGGAISITTGTAGSGGSAGGGSMIFTTGNGATNGLGGNMSFTAGNGAGTGLGGSLSLTAGTAGSTGLGGSISIRAGQGGATSGVGGFLSVIGGTAVGANGSSGENGGDVLFQGGTGASTGSTAGRGGHVVITGGTGGAASTNGTGGNVYISGGAPSAGSSFGNVIIGVASSTSNLRGMVGIGTTSPFAYLSVKATSSATINPFVIASSTNLELFVINPRGNVGIGTSSPIATLSVAVAADGTRSPFIIASSTTNTNVFEVTQDGKVKIGNPSFGNILSIETQGLTGNNSTISLRNSADTDEVSIAMQNTSSSWTSGVDSSGKFTIANYPGSLGLGQLFTILPTTGFVGIGTTTPGAKFSVGSGDAIVDGFIRSSYIVATSSTASLFGGNIALTSASPVIRQNTTDGSDNRSLSLSGGGATGDNRGANIFLEGNEYSGDFAGNLVLAAGNVAGSSGEGSIRFWTGNSADVARITNTGFFGIGTTSPLAKLSVAGGSAWIDGTITASSFIGTSTATSTFAGGIQSLELDITGSATSTFAQGINIATGCFAVNGTCIGGGGGGSGTVNSGTLGQVAFYNANGTAVSGTSTLTILDEKIGIGTTTPAAKLSVVKSGSGGSALDLITDSASPWALRVLNTAYTSNIDAAFALYQDNGGTANFYNGSTGAPRMSLTAAGRFAVGTATATIDSFEINQAGTSNNRFMGFVDTSVGGNTYEFVVGGNGVQSGLFSIYNRTSGTFALNVASTSNVGIGTVTPEAHFHISGTGNQESILESTGGTTPYAGYSLKTTTGKWGFFTGGASHPSIDGDFGIYDWDASLYRMVIKDDGNIGIGTTSPYAKLSVVGQVVGEYFTATSTTATSTFAGGVNVGKSLVLANYNCSANANGGALTTDASGYVVCSDDNTGAGSSQWLDSGSDIYFNTGKVGIGSSSPSYALTVTGTTSVGALIVGTPTTLPNAIVNVASSVDSYLQIAIQNKSAGTNASTDFVATNNLGDDTKYYVDLGINSSTYTNPSYTISGPNDAYLYNSDGALAIGTASTTNTNAVLKFHTGGTLASNERVRIDTDGDVGIGTTSVSERLQIEGGNVLIGKRNDVTGSWSAQTNAIGTIVTGGTSAIGTTTSMAVYNGSLYVGTEKASGAEVYRYNGTPGSWTKVSQSSAGTIAEDGGATTAITSVSAMAVYNGSLYIGTTKTDAAEVYRYDGNSTWTRISSSTAGAIGGIATTTTIDSVSSMAVHGGQLFIGTSESARAEVYRYDVADVSTAVGQNRWTRVSTSNGAGQNPGNIGADTAVNSINALTSYNGTLYAATSKASAGAIYQYRGYSGTGTGFTRINVAAGTFSGNGSTITTVTNVRKMAVYNGQLYAGIDGVASALNTARVVKLDANLASTTATWQVMSSTTAGTIFSATTTAQNIDRVTTMAIYKDDLYVGTLEGGLASVYKLSDGTTWDLVSSPSFGYIGGTSSTTVSAIGAMQVYNDDLWVGTGDPDGVEIFKYNVVEGESYALKFEATTDDGGEGALDGLKNTGSIMFVAEESAWSVNGNTNTGKFVVSHGINTAIGAYDVAEDYPTRDDTLIPGDLVSIDTAEKVMVKKSKGKNDQNIIGIFSSEPALRLSQKDTHIDGARAIPIALVGRVPVNVTTENGKIEIGDYLVASNEGGKAAKATKPGRVIGRALSAFEGRDGEKAQVMTYIGVETITWNDIAQAEETTEELTSGEADTSTDSVTEFVAAVNEAVADVAYAVINEMDNLTLVITNKLTAVVANIKDLFVSKLTLIPGGSITVPRGDNQIAGSAVIKAGDRDVRIDNNQIDDFSLISITPTSEVNSPLYVASKTAGEGFLVRIDKVSDKDITFDWFSIKTYDFEEQTTVINDEQEEVSSDDTVEDETDAEDDTDTDSSEETTDSDETTDEQSDTDSTSDDTTTIDDTTTEASGGGTGAVDENVDTTEGDSSSSDTSSGDTSSDSSPSDSSESPSGGGSDSGSSSNESSSGGSSSDSGSSSSGGDSGGGDGGGGSAE